MRSVYIFILTCFVLLGMPNLSVANDGRGQAASDKYAALCTSVEQAKINIRPSTKPIKYNFTRSIADMQGTKSDTINPYSYHAVTRTKGLMEGSIALRQEIKLGSETKPRYGGVCVWYKEINVDFEIDPTIHIAREVHADKCMGRAVMDHELQHVKIDREIVNEYSKIIGQKIYDGLKQRGFVTFVPLKDIKNAGKRMQQTVHQIVEHEYKRLELDRIERQRGHDTLEEYKRVSNQCPKFKLRL